MTLTAQACNEYWEKIKSQKDERISVSAADLKNLIDSVKILTEKVDKLTVQVEEFQNTRK